MAVPFIRYAYRFDSRLFNFTANNYTILIRDTTLGSDLNLDFATDERGFVINYPSEDDQFQDVMKGSNCVIGFLVQNMVDEAFVNALIADQEGKYFLEILKNGESFWKGVIAQDESRVENRAFPFVFEMTALDGISELKEISGDITPPGNVFTPVPSNVFHTLLQAIVFMLNSTRTALLFEDSDAMLQTAFKWYEDSMVLDVDPLANMGYLAQNIEFEYNNNGVVEFESFYDILENFLRFLNVRIFMSDGIFNIMQTNELNGATIDVFIYAKNYELTTADPQNAPTGLISSNLSKDLQVALENADPIQAGVNYNKEAGDIFAHLGAVREAIVGYDFELTTFYRAIKEDFELPGLFNTGVNVISGTGYALEIEGFIEFVKDFFGLNLVVVFEVDFFVKVGVNYWNGLAWTTTVAPAMSKKLTWSNLLTAPSPTHPIKLVILPPPTDGDLEFRTVTTSTITPDAIETTLTVKYVDTSGNPIKLGYKAINTTAPNSSIVIDMGDTIIGDIPSTYLIELRQWRVWNAVSYEASDLWQVNDAGTSRPINQTLVHELARVRQVPVPKWELSLLGDYTPFKTVVFDSREFIFNGGNFVGAEETWDLTLLEIIDPGETITVSEDPIDGNPTQSQNKNLQQSNQVVAELGFVGFESVSLGVSKVVVSGTITSISFTGITDANLRNGDVLTINDFNGHQETFTLNEDFDGSDLKFASKNFAFIYPSNSQINISTATLKSDSLGISAFTITGGTFNRFEASGETILELTQSNTYTLPLLSTIAKKSIVITFKNTSGGNATLQRTSPDLIDGEISIVIADNGKTRLLLTSDYKEI